MQFTNKDGEIIDVEDYQWVAVYEDGTSLCQFDYETGKYHYFAEIESERVRQFGLVCHTRQKAIFLDIPEKSKLIHYYDNIVQAPLGGTAIHHRLYCFGYESAKGKVIKTVLPDDFIVECDPENIGVL